MSVHIRMSRWDPSTGTITAHQWPTAVHFEIVLAVLPIVDINGLSNEAPGACLCS